MEKEESLTRRILAEILTEPGTNGKYDITPKKKIPSNRTDKVPTSKKSVRTTREEKLRHIINFGPGFYSIAEAHEISGIGESFIRSWISDGKLTLLTYPGGKRNYVSGIELSEIVIQHNLDKLDNI